MNVYSLKTPVSILVKNLEYYFPALILLLSWYVAPHLFALPQGNSEEIVTSIGLMVLLALISFLLIIALCWWLLQRFWINMGLPRLGEMVSQFYSLTLWEQLKFALCLFALFLVAGIGALIAIC
jgi:hypothetical protein